MERIFRFNISVLFLSESNGLQSPGKLASACLLSAFDRNSYLNIFWFLLRLKNWWLIKNETLQGPFLNHQKTHPFPKPQFDIRQLRCTKFIRFFTILILICLLRMKLVVSMSRYNHLQELRRAMNHAIVHEYKFPHVSNPPV